MARETEDWPDAPGGSEGYFRMKDVDDKGATVRILSQALRYSLGWKDKKPVRYAEGEIPPKEAKWDINKFSGDEQRPAFACALAVWSYAKDRVQVWEITQPTIYRQLRDLAGKARWGKLTEYDIEVAKQKVGDKIEYKVTPVPHEPLAESAAREWKMLNATWAGLDALLTGGDPFEGSAAASAQFATKATSSADDSAVEDRFAGDDADIPF